MAWKEQSVGKAGWFFLGTIGVAAALLLVWIFRPQRDCAFSGWKQTVGVELDSQINDLKQVQTKVGITDSQVREFDTLMKDYALKYDTACMDVRGGRMTQDVYTCLRKNMDSVLNEIRTFITAMEQAKAVPDPRAQKQIMLDSFAALRASSSAHYRGGCASALDVNPKRISFAGTVPERSVQITNRGNTDLTFSVDGLPEAFDPKPISGRLPQAATASVAILRTILPLSGATVLKFHVRSNMQDDEVVEIALDAKSASMWKDLADAATKIKDEFGPTGAASRVVAAAAGAGDSVSEADRLRLASCVLATMEEHGPAAMTLAQAIKADPSIENRPSTAILSGIIQLQQSNYKAAQSYFVDAKRKAGDDPVASSTSAIFVGLAMAKQNNLVDAATYVNRNVHLPFVQQNPNVRAFTERFACPGQVCTTTLLNQAFH